MQGTMALCVNDEDALVESYAFILGNTHVQKIGLELIF